MNNHINKYIHSHIQKKKVKTITILKLPKGFFEHSYRMECEEQKENSKIAFHLGTGTFCKFIGLF